MSLLQSTMDHFNQRALLATFAGAGIATVAGVFWGSKIFFRISTRVLNSGSSPEEKFINEMSLKQSSAQKRLHEATIKDDFSVMMSSPDEAQFLANLLKIIGAKKVIEVGVYTGYSTLSMAEALPADGTIIACDISDKWPSIGRPFWEEAGVSHKIDLRIAPALNTLEQLLSDGLEDTFDLAYIDADKPNYGNYFEACLKLVRRGGVVAIDNVFIISSVFDESKAPGMLVKMGKSIKQLNEKLKNDPRVDISMINIADGLTLCVKK